MRRYRHGSRWALWRWTSVVAGGSEYLRRLHLLKTPWFSVMLHWIRKPDPQPDMHDHPVSFLSLVLRGGYVEEVPDGLHWDMRGPLPQLVMRRRMRRVRRLNWKGATDLHRIAEARPGTLTLVLAGPKVREWGFLTADGWTPW